MMRFVGANQPRKRGEASQAVRTLRSGQSGGIFFRLIFFIFILVVCAVLYLARVPLLRLAGEFWVVDEPPETSDVIVVLSGDNYDAERATRAASLFKSGMAPRVVATGRALRSYATTTDLMKRDLVEHGVPESAIVPFTHKADDTRDEAAAVSESLSFVTKTSCSRSREVATTPMNLHPFSCVHSNPTASSPRIRVPPSSCSRLYISLNRLLNVEVPLTRRP